jgi:hypothetical protein
LSNVTWPVALAVVTVPTALAIALTAVLARRRDRRRYAERQRLLHEALGATYHAAAVGSLLTSFAHAGNNRLTVILSCLEVLEAAGPGDDDQRAAVRLALEATHKLADDLGALLAGGRGDQRGRERLLVHAAARRALLVRQAFGERTSLPVTLDVPDDLAVDVEPGSLETAVLRLCRFAERRGATALAVRGAAVTIQPRDPLRTALRAGHYCRLEFGLEGAGSLPRALLEPPAEPGHVATRLREPDGLEVAAVEAFAWSLRGLARAAHPAESDRPCVELYLPLAVNAPA